MTYYIPFSVAFSFFVVAIFSFTSFWKACGMVVPRTTLTDSIDG